MGTYTSLSRRVLSGLRPRLFTVRFQAKGNALSDPFEVSLADYRFSVQLISRGQGRSVVAAAAYRSGEELVCDRTGETWDFTRRSGVVETEILAPDNAPDWAKDRNRLWDEVEAAERRRDAQTAREIQVSLPHELTHAQRRDLVRIFVSEQLVARGMVADVAYHEPGRHGDQRNHHAHILVTTRSIGPEGFGPKERGWNSRELLETWRAQWAEKQNQALRSALGQAARDVSHRTLAARGLDRVPTRHLGPHQAAMERRGAATRNGDWNRQATSNRHERREHEAKLAVLQKQKSPPADRSLSELQNEIVGRAKQASEAMTAAREALARTIAQRRADRAAVREEDKAAFRARMKERLGTLPQQVRRAKAAARAAETRLLGSNPLLEMMAANVQPIVFAIRKFEQATAAMVARIKASEIEQAMRNRRTEVVLERQEQRVKPPAQRDALRAEERRHRRAVARARREGLALDRLFRAAGALRKAGVDRVAVTQVPVHDRAYVRELETAIAAAVQAAADQDKQAKAVPVQPRFVPRRRDEEPEHER